MARKKPARQEPTVSAEGSAALPAISPSSANKARAPRSSANAVTHRHKPAPTTGTETTDPMIVEEPVTSPAPVAVAPTPAAPEPAPVNVEAPSHDEIAVRAFLIAEARIFQNGSPEDDWFAAERQLWNERTAH